MAFVEGGAVRFSWGFWFDDSLCFCHRSLRLTLFLEGFSGRTLHNPWGGKTLFSYFVSEIRGNSCAFTYFSFFVFGSCLLSA